MLGIKLIDDLVETLVVGCNLLPTALGLKVVIADDTTLGRLAVGGLEIIVVGILGFIVAVESSQGYSLVDVVAGPLLVNIVGFGILALLVFGNELTVALVPLQGIIIVAGGVEGIDDVDNTCEGVFIGIVRVFYLDVGGVFLVGTGEVVVDRVAIHAEAELTTADIDKGVDIVAGGVALKSLKSSDHGDGHLHGAFIVSTRHEHIGQTTG